MNNKLKEAAETTAALDSMEQHFKRPTRWTVIEGWEIIEPHRDGYKSIAFLCDDTSERSAYSEEECRQMDKTADLIAAAPEMLAALKEVAIMITHGQVIRFGHPVFALLKNAIEKAEGKI